MKGSEKELVTELDRILSGWDRLPTVAGAHWTAWRNGMTMVSASQGGRAAGVVRVTRHQRGRDVRIAQWTRPDPTSIGDLLAASGMTKLRTEVSP